MDNVDPKDVVKVVQNYTGYITSTCRKYYIVGGTPEDLFQECVIGLLEACKSYKGESLFEPKFDAFAKKCIHRQIIDSIRHSNTLKNKALNEAKTIYAVNENGDEMQTLEIMPDRTTVNDPLEIILEKENTLAFDEKGVATAHRYDKLWEGELNINVERNEKGEMTSYIVMYADAEIAEVDAKYTYDKNGYLTTIEAMWYGESSSTEKIKYDEKNNRNESVTEYYDYDMTIVDEVKYIYNNFDEKGNWIEREAVKRNYTKDYEGEIIDETTTTSKERREIVYY